MYNYLQLARIFKNVDKAKVSYGNVKPVSALEFCKHNNITVEQLKDIEPDYKELDLLIPN